MVTLRAKPRKTVEDYLKLPEGTRAEFIEGEIFMSPSPKALHQRIVQRLLILLHEYVSRLRLGEVFVSPFDVHLPTGNVLQPDLVFVPTEKREIVRDWVFGVPDLLVEVVSPDGAERDKIVKRGLYAEAGVGEYWIVDGEERSVHVLVLKDGKYESFAYIKAPGAIESKLFPDLHAPLGPVFE